MHHKFGSILPLQGQRPNYVQMYFYDDDDWAKTQKANWSDLDKKSSY